MIVSIEQLSPFEWVSQHLQLIGWPLLVIAAWKVSAVFERLSIQAVKTVSQIDTMATNCFPTMQRSLQNQDTLLHNIDGSLKTLVERTPNPSD